MILYAKLPDGKGLPVPVTFPSGPQATYWRKVCAACGAVAGGCFGGPGLPAPRVSPGAVCPECGGRDIRLRPASESNERRAP